MSSTNHDKTRRDVLSAGFTALAGAAVAGVAAAGTAQASTGPIRLAQEKIAQSAVQYQTSPKNGQRCDACVNFEAPNACKIVAGTISPEGWCIAFAPKNG